MALTRRQIAIILSVIYLTALTVLAGYATHSSNRYSLPIPNTLNALTLALPAIAGLALETSNALATSMSGSRKYTQNKRSTIPPVLLPSTLTIVALLVYQTVIATLAGTRIAPLGGLRCSLQERWTHMFGAKDEDAIRSIQDAFECCGLMSSRDMAWPFPDKGHGAETCHTRFERSKPCFDSWRAEEQLVAGIMLTVAVGVFLWMVIVVATPAIHPTVIRENMRRPYPGDDAENDARSQRVIEYGRYSDNPEAEDQNGGEDTSVRREIAGLNSQSQLASMVEGSRVHPSGLIDDANKWREAPGA